MKILEVPKLARQELGEGLEWVDIVTEEDDVGFTQHELLMNGTGSTFTMDNKGMKYNHIYYILHGSCEVKLSDKSVYHLEKDSLLAVPHHISGVIRNEQDMKLSKILVFYAQPDTVKPAKELTPLMVTLKDIVGGAKDFYWGRGRSRRFLSRPDGFGLSVHNTNFDPGTTTELEYRNNIETNYVITGSVDYFWNDGADTVAFSQEKVEDGNGLVVFLDKNDKHTFKTQDVRTTVVCAFYPPLNGTEVHNLDGEIASSY